MNSDNHQITSASSSFSRRISRCSPISCFIGDQTSEDLTATFNDSESDTASTISLDSQYSSVSSSSPWLKSVRRGDHNNCLLKKKCASFISKLGNRRHRRTKHGISNFSYDPHSYALNFDDQAARFEYC